MGRESRRRRWDRGLRVRARLRRTRRQRKRLVAVLVAILTGLIIGLCAGRLAQPSPGSVARDIERARSEGPNLDPSVSQALRAFWELELHESQQRAPSIR